jgi:hypothetical protein
MSDMIAMEFEFDYGDLAAEKVLECETAFQTACAIENQATRMIGEQFAKVKANLKDLRNGDGWRGWCEKRLGFSHTQAQNYINEFENGGLVKNLYKFGKSSRFMLTAPTMPQEVRDQADAIAEAGGDTSVKAIKQLKADYEAERAARITAEADKAIWQTRQQESQQESNQRSQKIESLERRIDLFSTQPTPEPVKIVERVEVIPADYESLKAKAAQLETELATKDAELAQNKAEQNRIIKSAINSKMSGYQGKVDTCQREVDELERKKAMMEEQVERMKEYMASLDNESKRIEVHRNIIEKERLGLISLASFLRDEAPMLDPKTDKEWASLGGMYGDAERAIVTYRGSKQNHPTLTLIQGSAA